MGENSPIHLALSKLYAYIFKTEPGLDEEALEEIYIANADNTH